MPQEPKSRCARHLRWPHRLGIKMGVQADWSRKHRTMSHDLAIGELSEQEIRCIEEMRQKKVHDCDDNLLNLQEPRTPSGGGKLFVWLLLAIIGLQNMTLITMYLFAQNNKN